MYFRAWERDMICLKIAGVVVVSLSDPDDTPTASLPRPAPTSGRPSLAGISSGQRTLLGDCLALLSALFYAIYVILLKVRIRSESRINMQLFFSFIDFDPLAKQ